jgi:hypothetical protein
MPTLRAVSIVYGTHNDTLQAVMTDGSVRVHRNVRAFQAIELAASKNSYGGYRLYASFAKRHPYSTLKATT